MISRPNTVFLLPAFLLLTGLVTPRCAAQAPLPQPPPAQQLTLQQAEQIALQNHPQVQAAMSVATAAQAQVRATRSAYFPNAYGSVSGAASLAADRIGAGTFNDPRIFNKFADGLTVNQLVTDFGRTHEMVKSSSQHSQAEQENVVTSRADVLLGADQAYFAAMRAQALLRVAQQTVKARQLVHDQIATLAQNSLKSELDVTFASVDLAQAQLLLIQAQNDLEASFAQLSVALGYPDERTFELAEQPMPGAPAPDVNGLIQQAMQNRPDLISQRYNVNSAQSFATAERDLYFPTLSAVGAAGVIPLHEIGNGLNDHYAAAGFNLNIPIFNGHLFGSLRTEASAQAQAQTQYLRDLTDKIARDVRTAWLNANAGYQRLSVTEQLLNQATMSLSLAQSRYQLGLSSIVELSQAQLNLTQAQIEEASAKYDYQAQTSMLNFAIGMTP